MHLGKEHLPPQIITGITSTKIYYLIYDIGNNSWLFILVLIWLLFVNYSNSIEVYALDQSNLEYHRIASLDYEVFNISKNLTLFLTLPFTNIEVFMNEIALLPEFEMIE